MKSYEVIETIRRIHNGEMVVAEEVIYPSLNESGDTYDY